MENAIGQINYLAVVAAAILAFVLGGLWYGPLFGKAWMSASGANPDAGEDGHAARVYAVSFVCALLGAWFFAMFLGQAPALAFATAVGFGTGLIWIGGSFAINYQFERKPTKLLMINGGYHTCQYSLYGLILGLWH